MSEELVSTPDRRHRGAQIPLAGVAGAIAGAVAVWLVARYGAGLHLHMPAFSSGQHPSSLSVGFVVVAAAVASLAGWGAVTLIGRLSRRPRRAWITTGIVATVVSLSAPLSGHGITATERLALVCMHLAVAAVVVPVFALTLRSRRPSVNDVPARADADRRPSSTTPAPR
jgi:hypothetical protein